MLAGQAQDASIQTVVEDAQPGSSGSGLLGAGNPVSSPGVPDATATDSAPEPRYVGRPGRYGGSTLTEDRRARVASSRKTSASTWSLVRAAPRRLFISFRFSKHRRNSQAL